MNIQRPLFVEDIVHEMRQVVILVKDLMQFADHGEFVGRTVHDSDFFMDHIQGYPAFKDNFIGYILREKAFPYQ